MQSRICFSIIKVSMWNEMSMTLTLNRDWKLTLDIYKHCVSKSYAELHFLTKRKWIFCWSKKKFFHVLIYRWCPLGRIRPINIFLQLYFYIARTFFPVLFLGRAQTNQQLSCTKFFILACRIPRISTQKTTFSKKFNFHFRMSYTLTSG